METIRDVLNRMRWDPSADGAAVVLRVRVRHDGRETVDEIAFADVAGILPGGVECGGGVFIPYHRVVEIVDAGRTLWPSGPDGAGDA